MLFSLTVLRFAGKLIYFTLGFTVILEIAFAIVNFAIGSVVTGIIFLIVGAFLGMLFNIVEFDLTFFT